MPEDKTISSKPHATTEVVEKMYMQINNISQGFAIAILIDVLAQRFLNNVHIINIEDFTALLLGLTSLSISIVFWTRYYFDTFIIKRSFSVRSIVWFFAYIVSEGVSFKQINQPVNWCVSTGIFLLFGFGFYILNLREIYKKRGNKFKLNLPNEYSNTLNKYIFWQKLRLIDLFILMLLAFAGALLTSKYNLLQYPVGAVTLVIALWQLSKSRDYKKFGFSNSQI
jgi:hypothetical protein